MNLNNVSDCNKFFDLNFYYASEDEKIKTDVVQVMGEEDQDVKNTDNALFEIKSPKIDLKDIMSNIIDGSMSFIKDKLSFMGVKEKLSEKARLQAVKKICENLNKTNWDLSRYQEQTLIKLILVKFIENILEHHNKTPLSSEQESVTFDFLKTIYHSIDLWDYSELANKASLFIQGLKNSKQISAFQSIATLCQTEEELFELTIKEIKSSKNKSSCKEVVNNQMNHLIFATHQKSFFLSELVFKYVLNQLEKIREAQEETICQMIKISLNKEVFNNEKRLKTLVKKVKDNNPTFLEVKKFSIYLNQLISLHKSQSIHVKDAFKNIVLCDTGRSSQCKFQIIDLQKRLNNYEKFIIGKMDSLRSLITLFKMTLEDYLIPVEDDIDKEQELEKQRLKLENEIKNQKEIDSIFDNVKTKLNNESDGLDKDMFGFCSSIFEMTNGFQKSTASLLDLIKETGKVKKQSSKEMQIKLKEHFSSKDIEALQRDASLGVKQWNIVLDNLEMFKDVLNGCVKLAGKDIEVLITNLSEIKEFDLADSLWSKEELTKPLITKSKKKKPVKDIPLKIEPKKSEKIQEKKLEKSKVVKIIEISPEQVVTSMLEDTISSLSKKS